MSSIERLFLNFCLKFPQGTNDKQFRMAFPNISAADLVLAINSLVAKGEIELFKSSDGLVYRTTKTDEPNGIIISSLEGDEKIVYQCIKSTANKGIWTRDLKTRTNLHQAVITKVLRSLESKKLIKSVKSVKNSTRKVYMLAHLEPSIDLTGGPWFSENELDSEFIEEMCKICYRYILSKSVSKLPGHILPAVYANFPSLYQIVQFIEDSRVTTAALTTDDVLMLLNRLIYDGLIRKVASRAVIASRIVEDEEDDIIYVYKAVVNTSQSESMLGAIPCGCCPVLSICNDSGPITPQNCVYFTEWLSF